MPGLNTTATADISFMMLIFFLVTTSMDSDKGLGRMMPPYEPDRQDEQKDVDKDKVMTLHLTKDGLTTMEGKPAKIDHRLRKDVRHFIITRGASHIIELQIDRDADYDSYFQLQNQIVRAYREVRDAAAKKKYGASLISLNEDQQSEINSYFPQRIQETVLP